MRKNYLKLLIALVAILTVTSVSSCSTNKKHDFLDFDFGMDESEITKVVEAHNGSVSDGPWGNTLTCDFDEGYEGFPIDDFDITMFVSEDTDLDMMMTTIRFFHDKDEDKEAEYKMLLEYLNEQYGKSSLDGDEYVWEARARNGNKMTISLDLQIKSAKDILSKDSSVAYSLRLNDMINTTMMITVRENK